MTILDSFLQVVVGAWHDMTNVNYHCWPLEADAENSKAYQVSDVKGDLFVFFSALIFL